MNGELAQVVALTTHGTAWLRDPGAPPPDLERTSWTFRFVGSLTFRDERRRLRRRQWTTVEAWLGELRAREVERLWLVAPPWRMLADAPRGVSQWWDVAWNVGDRAAADQRIWDVRYRGLAGAAPPAPPAPPVPVAAETLRRALDGAHRFARAHDLSPWTELFAGAMDSQPDTELAPGSFPDEARRLLAAAAQSWVFGGMGSWNDLGFGDPDQEAVYRDVTGALYDAVLAGFVAGCNVELGPVSG